MCSNTGSTGCGGGCGCGTGANGTANIWSSGLKKQQKRPRVPKRGPGVAELEKILREQEKIDRPDRCNAEGFSFIPHHSSPYNSSSLKSHPPPPPPPPPAPPSPPTSPLSMTMTSRRMTVTPPASSSLPAHVPLAPKFDHISPTTPTPAAMTSLYGSGGCGYNTALGRNGASAVGGSGLVLPEQELFPMNLGSCKLNNNEGVDASQSDSGNSSSRNLSGESNPIWTYPASIQKRNNQYPPPMMNQFPGTGTPISSGSLQTGLHNHVEPPSNQSSCYNYTSRAPEEQKMIGMKRSHPSPLDNSLIPPSNFQISPTFSHYNRPHQSSLNDSHSAKSFTASSECHRDAKWGSILELNSRKFNSDNGMPGHANFPSFATSEVPSPPMHLFQGVLSKGKLQPYQVTEGRMEDSYQRSESSPSDHKPFYSFLEVKDQTGVKETTLGSDHGGREAGSSGIDLTLKL